MNNPRSQIGVGFIAGIVVVIAIFLIGGRLTEINLFGKEFDLSPSDWIAIIMLVVAAIALMNDARTRREQWQIAVKSGTFRQPNLGLAVFGPSVPVGEGYPDNELWYFVHPGKDDDTVLFPIRFVISNIGDAASEDVVMTIHVPQSCFPSSAKRATELAVIPGVLQDSAKWSVNETGHYSFLAFALPTIKPKSHVELEIPFSLHPSFNRKSTAKIPIHGKSPVNMPVGFSVAYIFAISLLPRNSEPISSQINVVAVPATSVEDAIKQYTKVRKQILAARPKSSILQRLWNMFTTILEPNVINFLAFDIRRRGKDDTEVDYILSLPEELSRRAHVPGITNITTQCRLKAPSPARLGRRRDGGLSVTLRCNTNEPGAVQSGQIISVVDFEQVPRKARKRRAREGNLVQV